MLGADQGLFERPALLQVADAVHGMTRGAHDVIRVSPEADRLTADRRHTLLREVVE
jgi:hypothetical protein